MKKYVEIFNELSNESSTKAKEQLLLKHQDVEGFQDILKFVYNQLITSGLAKKKIEKNVTEAPQTKLTTIFEAIEYVKVNNTGTDQVVACVQAFLDTLETEDERELAKAILLKDIPAGIGRTTLNKVYGKDFVPKYTVMLASKFDDKTSKKIDGAFALSLKIDGNRATVFNFAEGPVFMARSGKEIEGLVELAEEFKKLPKGMVYDGELVAINEGNIPAKELFNVTQTLVRKKGNKIGLEFIMFDMLPINEFNEGKSKKSYEERVNGDMTHMFNNDIPADSLIQIVPIYYVGTDLNRIPKILQNVEDLGYEGLMLNLLNAKYETKRTKGLLKIKTFHTADLHCVGIKEDIRGGKCGSFTVDYKGHRVDVAGLNDEQKEAFWLNPDLVVGKIVEVKYFEESTNKQNTLSLRFPSLVRIREDKSVEDVSYA